MYAKFKSVLMDKSFSNLEVGRDIVLYILDNTELILESNFEDETCRKSVIIGDGSKSYWLRLNVALILDFN